jgi:hypothetical protein
MADAAKMLQRAHDGARCSSDSQANGAGGQGSYQSTEIVHDAPAVLGSTDGSPATH